MNIKNVISLACVLAFSSSAFAENTVVATHGANKSGAQTVAIDFQSGGDASAFQFLLELPKGASKISLTNCVSGLPSTHVGECRASEKSGRVAVVVYSVSNTPLPSGMHEVGTVSYHSRLIAKPGLSKMVVGSASGKGESPVSKQVVSINEPSVRANESVK